jgi:two-component system chemotaxis response regulator CheB
VKKYNLQSDYKAIAIGGSAGSFQGIIKILSQIPEDFSVPIIVAMHRLKHVRHGFLEVVSMKSRLKIVEPDDKESIRKGTVYLAPANYHMSVELGNYFALSTEEMVNSSRPSIDITLASAAYVYRHKLIGILLSGANRDGGLGMKAIKDKGGLTIVQEPSECLMETMPRAALSLTTIDYVLTVDNIVEFLTELHYSSK